MELPTGFLTEERFDGLVTLSKGALNHMMDHGEVPSFIGRPMNRADAVAYLEGWLDRNRSTLTEAGIDFLASFARKIAVGDEPEQPIEEFEASLGALTDEQLTVLNAAEASRVEAAKLDVIDRRRELVADALEVGKELLRGAIATGLRALMAEIGVPGPGPLPAPNGGTG